MGTVRPWTEEHKRLVGRVIFANFLEIPLERYRKIIEETELSISSRWGSVITMRALSRAKIAGDKTSGSSKTIAEIVRNSRGSSIYIGSTRNIKKRLREHLGENSKNGRIRAFLKKHGCSFRYILFKKDWHEEEKRLYRLFMDTYGSPPKCNRGRP